jgi:hypothetical protein
VQHRMAALDSQKHREEAERVAKGGTLDQIKAQERILEAQEEARPVLRAVCL